MFLDFELNSLGFYFPCWKVYCLLLASHIQINFNEAEPKRREGEECDGELGVLTL